MIGVLSYLFIEQLFQWYRRALYSQLVTERALLEGGYLLTGSAQPSHQLIVRLLVDSVVAVLVLPLSQQTLNTTPNLVQIIEIKFTKLQGGYTPE